jgi:thiosulfate dehydrogenase (quinone) large subunit
MDRLKALDAKLQGWTLGLMRIVVGLLWLANLEWKRPADFGLDLKNGLYKYVDSAVRLPVWDPYAWFVENVVLKQYRLFGWITLITEILLAALLLIGWKTRLISLVGAGLSVSILLSVLNYDKAYEWPWSYYLMIAIHLLLWATSAGLHLGVDGAVKRGITGAAGIWRGLGVSLIVCGAVGVYAARNKGFFEEQGARVGWKYETNFLWFNLFSALLTIVLGAMLLAAAFTKVKALVLIPGVVCTLLVVQVLVQWRYNQGEWTGGFTGATGATAALWFAAAIACFVTLRAAQRSAAGSALNSND